MSAGVGRSRSGVRVRCQRAFSAGEIGKWKRTAMIRCDLSFGSMLPVQFGQGTRRAERGAFATFWRQQRNDRPGQVISLAMK